MLEAIGPLTDPTAHGGRAEDAFDVVVPSIPGYGFSAEPTELGWWAGRVAQAWGKLMPRLGYTRYVAQGGDVGAAVTDAMGRQAPEGLIGIHMNLFVPGLVNPSAFPVESEEEHAAADAITTFRTTGNAYLIEQNTRPQTIGYALLDSPIALAAWMLDHDTDAYHKISSAFVGGKPSGNLTRDHILDNITTYWLTATGASAARSYWEGAQAGAAAAQPVTRPRRSRSPWDSLPSPARSADPAELGRAGLPNRGLLQRGRQGRPLRRLGRARPLHDRATGRIQVPSLAGRARGLRGVVLEAEWLNFEPPRPSDLVTTDPCPNYPRKA